MFMFELLLPTLGRNEKNFRNLIFVEVQGAYQISMNVSVNKNFKIQ